jgi:hypothetical protein
LTSFGNFSGVAKWPDHNIFNGVHRFIPGFHASLPPLLGISSKQVQIRTILQQFFGGF